MSVPFPVLVMHSAPAILGAIAGFFGAGVAALGFSHWFGGTHSHAQFRGAAFVGTALMAIGFQFMMNVPTWAHNAIIACGVVLFLFGDMVLLMDKRLTREYHERQRERMHSV